MTHEKDHKENFPIGPPINRNGVRASDFLILWKSEIGISVFHAFLGYATNEEDDDVV